MAFYHCMKSSGSSGDLRTENVTFTAQPVTSGQSNTVTLSCSTLTEIVGIAAITQQSGIDFRSGIKACSFNGNQATIEYYLFNTASAKDVTITFIGTTTTPVPDMELLWTNPNPSSSFAAQTVALDLSPYKSICIDYRVATTGTERHTYAFYSVGDNITIPTTSQGYPTVIAAAYGKTTEMSSIARNISIATNGITFGSGYASTLGASNNYALPSKIYGIKAQIYPDNP